MAQNEVQIRQEILKLFRESLDEQFYGDVLDVVRKTLGSPHGAFGYIDGDGAWICASLTRDIWEACEVQDKNIRFPRELMMALPNWRQAYLYLKTVRVNDPVSVPPGHLPVNRIMIVPIVWQETLVGMIAVANRDKPYTASDQQALEDIASSLAMNLSMRVETTVMFQVIEERLARLERVTERISEGGR